MTNPLDNYSAGAADWRSSLKENNRKTVMVITLFFLIYIVVGVLIDTAIYLETVPVTVNNPSPDISTIFQQLITFQLFPLATLAMMAIAGVSLFVTYSFSNRLMLLGTEYREITADNASNIEDKKLYNVIEELQIAAGLAYMPRVYIIDADYMNAFASGISEKSAMVAITRGLMQKLDRDELQAVMAHELSHIRHMDIKLTVTASLLANLTLMVLDMFFFAAISGRRSRDSKANNIISLLIVLRYLMPIINIILLMYLSRKRELMADAGAVQLTRTNEPLARALIKISGDYQDHQADYQAAIQQTPHESVRREAYLYDPSQAGVMNVSSINDMFSTHPSLETRLQALGYHHKK